MNIFELKICFVTPLAIWEDYLALSFLSSTKTLSPANFWTSFFKLISYYQCLDSDVAKWDIDSFLNELRKENILKNLLDSF